MRPYLIAVACSWLALIAAAAFYTREYPSLHWILTAALPAFMVETLFYLGSLFENSRRWFASLGGARRQAALLWLSALLPYLIFSIGAGVVTRNGFYLLALLSGILAFWHAVLPRRLAYDAGFLIVAAAPFITKVFSRIYVSPDQHLKVDILGHLMWIRLGLISLLVFREWDPGPIGLWPKKREWLIGTLWFVLMILPISFTALELHDVRFSPLPYPWWKIAGIAVGTFFGFLWVVSLAEELFFRGFIQRALLDSAKSPVLAILVTAVLFGSVHLWFHQFPNWQRSAVVVILGIGCGLAYLQTGSIRASMVTHALTIVCWRILFK
jgi:membrane protease YdiL (CAAX protease family)